MRDGQSVSDAGLVARWAALDDVTEWMDDGMTAAVVKLLLTEVPGPCLTPSSEHWKLRLVSSNMHSLHRAAFVRPELYMNSTGASQPN